MILEPRFEFLFFISLTKNIKKYIFSTFQEVFKFSSNTYKFYNLIYTVGLKITQIKAYSIEAYNISYIISYII